MTDDDRKPRINDNTPMPYRFGQFPKVSPPQRNCAGWVVGLQYGNEIDEYRFKTEEKARRFYDEKVTRYGTVDGR